MTTHTHGSFAGAADTYGQHRPGYPPDLLAGLVARVQPTGRGTLLDVACGTGELAVALRSSFTVVVAIDQEAELVEAGRHAAGASGIDITWMVGAAEDHEPPVPYELVTIGNAFHHFDRPALSRRILGWLRPGGCLAVIGSDSVLAGDDPWKDDLFAVVERFHPGLDRPVGATGWAGPDALDHSSVLRQAGFQTVEEWGCPTRHRFTVDGLLAYLHATWFGSPGALGPRLPAFDDAVRAALAPYATQLDETITYHGVLGRRTV